MEQQKLVLKEQDQALGIRRSLTLCTRLPLSSGVEATVIIVAQVLSTSATAMVVPTATTGSAQCV